MLRLAVLYAIILPHTQELQIIVDLFVFPRFLRILEVSEAQLYEYVYNI